MIRITTDKKDEQRVLTKISKDTSYREIIVGAATLIEVLVNNECNTLDNILDDITRMIAKNNQKGEE